MLGVTATAFLSLPLLRSTRCVGRLHRLTLPSEDNAGQRANHTMRRTQRNTKTRPNAYADRRRKLDAEPLLKIQDDDVLADRAHHLLAEDEEAEGDAGRADHEGVVFTVGGVVHQDQEWTDRISNII